MKTIDKITEAIGTKKTATILDLIFDLEWEVSVNGSEAARETYETLLKTLGVE